MLGLSPPGDRSDLVGRDPAIRTIVDRLATSQLVTLTGLGGIGKTAVAREIARRHLALGGRAVMVDLVSVDRAGAVATAVASAVGAADDPAGDLLASVIERLDAAPALLVLDNFEHVLDAAGLVELLGTTTHDDVQVLVTSRVALGIPSEAVVSLEPLELPAAAGDIESATASALFLRRARERGRLHELDPDDASAIVEICARLDGLPLALEIAAGWSGLLTPRAIARRLADGRLDMTGTDARQASVAAIVDATLGLVGEKARQVFPSLGVFSGPFDEAAADAVLDVRGSLTALRDLERVALVRPSADVRGEPRFELLETIRAAALQVASDRQRRAAARRHIAHYADRAVAAAAAVRQTSFHDPGAGRDLADPNVGVALSRAFELRMGDPAVRLAAALATRAMQTGILREPLAQLERAMTLPGLTVATRSDGMNALVSLRGALGLTDGQEAGAREALRLARAARSPERIVRTLITVGNWTSEGAAGCYSEAAELAESVGYGWGAATAWSGLGDALWIEGRTDAAIAAAERGRAASLRDGDHAGVASRGLSLGEYELNLGRTEAALSHLTESVAMFREHPGLPFFQTAAECVLAAAEARSGNVGGAYRTLSRAGRRVATAESAEDLTSWLEAAAIVLETRHPVMAIRCVGAVEEIAAMSGLPRASQRLHHDAVRRIELVIGRARVEQERAAGRSANPSVLFADVDRTVRREAGPDADLIVAPFGSLTAREQEVLVQLADGRTDRQIGDALGMTPKTASVHVANLKAKLGVQTRVEAALFARDRLGRPVPAESPGSGHGGGGPERH